MDTIQSIIKAIILATDKKINNAPFDKTVQGRITEVLPKNKCKVLIDGKEFNVRTKASHSVNEVVDICIPQNNKNRMYIVPSGMSGGSITGDTKDCTVSFTEPIDELDVVSGDSHSTIVGKFVKSIRVIKSSIGILTNLKTDSKDNLVSSINEIKNKSDLAFQSASNGKTLIKNAITGVDPEVIIPTDPTFAQLATAIGDIETGIDTSDATATAGDIVAPKSAYGKDGKMIGTMPDRGTVNHSLPINGNYTIPAGKHSGSGKVTQSITTKDAQTYTPTTVDQSIPSERYLIGVQTIKGDANLVPSKLPNDLTLFGVKGTRNLGLPGVAGITQVSSDTRLFQNYGMGEQSRYIEVSGLTLQSKPTRIIVVPTGTSNIVLQTGAFATVYAKNNHTSGYRTIYVCGIGRVYDDNEFSTGSPNTSAYIYTTGFCLPIYYLNGISQYQWIIIF